MQLATAIPQIRSDIINAVRGIPRTANVAAMFPFAGFSQPVTLDYWKAS